MSCESCIIFCLGKHANRDAGAKIGQGGGGQKIQKGISIG